MNYKIVKLKTLKGKDKFELRAWDGVGDKRVEWKRRFNFKSEAQAFVDERVFKERESRLAAKHSGDPMSAHTFEDEYQNWRATRFPDFAPGWKRNLEMYWAELSPRIGAIQIKKFTPTLMREVERELRENGNSKSTVQRKIVWIQSVLNYSVSMERIPYNPIARFRPAKPPKAELEYWEKDEALSFLEFTLKKYPRGSANHWRYLVYLVALNTAMRSGEIWALRPSCLKQSFGVIYLTRQLDLAERTFRPLKGKVARNVPLSATVANALLDWIEDRKIEPSELILTHSGLPQDHNNFNKRIFVNDVREWGGRRIKFHGLRHTAATLMLDSGVDIRTVQLILGHASLETTMRYVHALGHNVRRAGDIFSLAPATIILNVPSPSQKLIQITKRVEPN